MSVHRRETFALREPLSRGLARLGQAVLAMRLRQSVLLLVSGLLFSLAAIELLVQDRGLTALLLVAALVLALAANRRSAVSGQVSDRVVVIEGAAVEPRSEIVVQLAATQRAAMRSPAPVSTEAWGDLMARVSHDMRTPLNAVIGFSDVMTAELFGPVGDERYREYIAHIRDSGRELLKSAEDTLAITSLLAGDDRPSDTIGLLQLVEEARRAAGACSVKCDIDDDLEILGERRSLRQVLVNLLREAAVRSQGDGRASLHAYGEDEFVIVELMVSGGASRPTGHEGSLHVCMARVLLELTGARLIEIERGGVWRAVTVLGRAAQADFFLKAPGAGSAAARLFAN